jgi:hypothetical protein
MEVRMSHKNKANALIKEMGRFSWFSEKNNQELALSLLKEFLYEYKKVKPDKQIIKYHHLSNYLIHLFSIRNALYKDDYGVACHEIETLAAHNGIYQVRIYANLVKLLEEYLCSEKNAEN